VRTIAFFLLVLAGCSQSPSPSSTAGACDSDSDCIGGVCARSGECAAVTEIQTVHVHWLIAGKPADASTCDAYPNLTVEFLTSPPPNNEPLLSFAPVPCIEGEFTADRIPTWFWIAGVRNREAGMDVPIGADGMARLDLPY